MIELQNIPDPERYARYYVMTRNEEGQPEFLGAGGYGWYKNPADAKEHWSVSCAKGARTRYLNTRRWYQDHYSLNLRGNVEIVKIVIDSYHLDPIC